MSAPAYTPGPWKFVPWHIEEGSSAVRAPEGWLICTTSSDADATLIAAAPDLAGALKAAEKWLSPRGVPEDIKATIHAALAKAGVG